ncbi:MAG TPA: glycosyltransferase family 2 protein [Candidatus Limnocylindria bacterium]|nr:glycosyltransferase family 2 protein [Candidatus Limnocylindria bacterium]
MIPAKNEAANIGWVLERIPSFVDEVIVVDGLSTDGTLEVAKMIVPDVVVIHETTKGKGAALRAGFAAARGDYVVMLDADGSMDPIEIERFVEHLRAGFDMVKGSRFISGGGTTDMTWLRRFGNARLLEVANTVFGTRFTELCYGYCAFRRSALDRLALDAVGFEIETQIVTRAVRAGLKIAEVPSVEYPRRSGESNLNTFRDGWRVLMTMLRERYGGAPSTGPSWTSIEPIRVEVDELEPDPTG